MGYSFSAGCVSSKNKGLAHLNTTIRFNHKVVEGVYAQVETSVTPMQRLKAATNAQHLALEATVNLVRLSSSLPAYHALLRRFYGFYAPIEAQLATLPWSTVNFDITGRAKSALLAADLIWLGETPTSLADLPRCPTLPDLADIPQALGYLYVSEGATLGGQIIMRQLRKHLPISPSAGGQFYNSYGAAVGPMWQTLGHFINSFINMSNAENRLFERTGLPMLSAEKRMLQTACLTFQALQQWLVAGETPSPAR
jgi:heme oxygenase (biliverdin-IX-beta and delta-forming)